MAQNETTSRIPQQRLPISKKTKKWREQCVEGYIALSDIHHVHGDHDVERFYRYYNGDIDDSDYKHVLKPYGKSRKNFPSEIRNFPIIKPIIDLLLGEKSKRPLNYSVTVQNADAVTMKEQAKMEALYQNLQQRFLQEVGDEAMAQGANPEVANMHMKRVNISSEPENGKGLNSENIKKLTGNNEINARKLYSSNTTTRLLATQIMEANSIPKINSKIGTAEIERFIIVPFYSLFLKDITEPEINENNIGNKYPQDVRLKLDEFQRIHKHALFEWILNNAPKDIYIPDVVKKVTQNYLLSCDDIVGFCEDLIEYTGYDINDPNKQDFISAKDLFDLYKISESYVNKDKAEKRKYNQSAFKDDLRTNQKFAKHYKEKCKSKGKAYNKNSILLGWRLKEEDEFEEDPTM